MSYNRVRRRGELTPGQATVEDPKQDANGNFIGYKAPIIIGTPPHNSGDLEVILDTKHKWPPRKGDYIVGPVLRTREKLSLGVANGVFPVTAYPGGGWWGPRRMIGHVLSSADNTGGISYPSYLSSDREAIKQQVIIQAFAKAYGSQATLLVTAGELHKSIAMVNSPLGQARNLLGQMTRRYRSLLSRGLSATRAAGSAWLEYRMGWKPLLYDLENIAKATHKYLAEIDASYDQTYRAAISQNWGGGGVKAASGGYFNAAELGWSASLRCKIAAGVILRENLFDEKSKPFQRLFGVQLHDIAPAVWEVMPYSFVVDRFVDVQSWLEAIQPRPNTKLLTSWVTTTMETNETTSFSKARARIGPVGNQVDVYFTDAGGSNTAQRFTYQRDVDVRPTMYPVLNTRELKLNQHLDHASLVLGQLVGLFPEVTSRNFGNTLDKTKWVSFSSRKMRHP